MEDIQAIIRSMYVLKRLRTELIPLSPPLQSSKGGVAHGRQELVPSAAGKDHDNDNEHDADDHEQDGGRLSRSIEELRMRASQLPHTASWRSSHRSPSSTGSAALAAQDDLGATLSRSLSDPGQRAQRQPLAWVSTHSTPESLRSSIQSVGSERVLLQQAPAPAMSRSSDASSSRSSRSRSSGSIPATAPTGAPRFTRSQIRSLVREVLGSEYSTSQGSASLPSGRHADVVLQSSSDESSSISIIGRA